MLYNTLIDLINEQSVKDVLRTTYTKPLVDAIKNRRKITFEYYGPRKPKKDSVRPGKRINVEPYAIGLNKKGKLVLRAWADVPSVSKKGFTKTNWRTFIVSRMKNTVVNNEIFDGNRPGYKQGDDKSMTVTYISLDKNAQIKPVPQKKQVQPKIKEKPQPAKAEKPAKPETTPLPQPKPKEPPQPSPEVQPIEKKPEELPQPKPEIKPEKNPEEDKPEEINKDKTLQESIKRMKTLMFL